MSICQADDVVRVFDLEHDEIFTDKLTAELSAKTAEETISLKNALARIYRNWHEDS